MAGALTPVVMLPRYSTYAGETTFTTIAMDVSPYQRAILGVWRGILVGTDFEVTCEESADQEDWTVCDGTNAEDFDPGEEDEGPVTATLRKRWFRLKIVLTGTDPQVTCWAVGFLEEREE